MLRTVLIVLALLIVAVLGATALGLLDFTKSQDPEAPKFTVKVNDVDVGTTTRQVDIPTLRVDNGAAPAATPAPAPAPAPAPGNSQ